MPRLHRFLLYLAVQLFVVAMQLSGYGSYIENGEVVYTVGNIWLATINGLVMGAWVAELIHIVRGPRRGLRR